ncbi:hypothetical protein ANCCEY_09244 [Ancylostoma ceylanicum]|uniref:Uncharacterized protein n=1 Tax=Ancylostoma ceylanicum TaxID=53326 RepID=A0A0D6LI40_9BILA|nr:hypothetical protein ANCCEY_09244 [Ancylostoma ceylanicum]
MSSRHGSSEDVAKVTEELSYCRTRLDAGVQENRRNRDIIQGLTEQILAAFHHHLAVTLLYARLIFCFSFATLLANIRANPEIPEAYRTGLGTPRLTCSTGLLVAAINYRNGLVAIH